MYVTHHAFERAKNRLGYSSAEKLKKDALSAMEKGKRKDHRMFIYNGTVFCFNFKLDTLMTVYVA